MSRLGGRVRTEFWACRMELANFLAAKRRPVIAWHGSIGAAEERFYDCFYAGLSTPEAT